MKSFLLLTTLALTSAAFATESPANICIAPAPDANLYAAFVPEPTHAMLLLMGLVGLTVRRRR